MVKGTPNLRLFFNSKKDSPTKTNEAAQDLSTARPPLSTLTASARNNSSSIPPVHPASSSHAKLDRRSPQPLKRGSLTGQTSYPHLENVDSNVIASASTTSTPEKYVTPYGTPKNKASKRSTGCLPRQLSSSDLDSLHQLDSTDVYGDCLARTPSNTTSLATSSDGETTSSEDSGPSSTSESDVENIHSKSRCAERQEGIRRISLGPKIEAAVSKLERTPSKALRPGKNGTPTASPGSLRAGVQRALVLQHPNVKESNEVQKHFEIQENLSFWNDHNVQVLIRTRPISGSEVAKQDQGRCLRQDSAHAITWLGQPETRFTFDHVAGENISQEKLFRVVGLPMVENCMAGYNSCMFAYGQTGSGKTHTMLGDIEYLANRPNDNRGMTPRIFEYLFSRIVKEEQDRQLEQLRYVCKCSFLEIYNEQVTDLLEPSSTNLQLREDSKKGVYVENLTEVVVSSVQDVVLLLLKGASNRKVASTNMNRESSRSHSVFTCSIESKWESNSLINMRFGRLNLVDLAGSERQKTSGAEGDRLKEAANINKSLSTLGLVIMILVDIANGKQRHVPYRDSKLTFLLQDSLGGNSKTAIIATVSPSGCCAMETLSTLKFAQRAKFIQNNAVINEDASGEVLALRREIQQLKEEVSRLRCQTLSSMRRDCRRESNEFFRMSLTGKDLFDAAEKERTDEGEDLKSAELLEKIKALEAVLAGALRREQAADMATKKLLAENEKIHTLIQESEEEKQGCKKLLCLQAEKLSHLQSFAESELSVDSYLTEENKMLLEKIAILERLVSHNPEITKSALHNTRLTEQLLSYELFYNSGERETMAKELQGLRDQVLELLDGKIAIERGSLSLTAAQGDGYRKELETCRNDLTNCLEASAQMQRQVDELQLIIDQLTQQYADKEKELDVMKLNGDGQDRCRCSEIEIERALHKEQIAELLRQLQDRQDMLDFDAGVRGRLEHELEGALKETQKLQAELQESINMWSAKYANMVNQKEQEVKTLQIEWETATAKLLSDLAEGDRALIEAEQEMEEIMGEDWLLKSLQDKTQRWSLESDKSLKEVDKEHDYFKGRDSNNSEDIFVKRKRSLSLAQGASIIIEEKLKLEGDVIRLELELEECKQRVQKVEGLQVELHNSKKETLELREEVETLTQKSLDALKILEDNVNLKRTLEQLQITLDERSEAVQIMLAKRDVLQDMEELETSKAGAQEAYTAKSQEASNLLAAELQLTDLITRLDLELNETRERAEEAQSAVVDMARDNGELREESAHLRIRAQEAAVLQTSLEIRIEELEAALGEYQKVSSGLQSEIKQLKASIEEIQGRNQELAGAVSDEKEAILVLEEEMKKLESELKLCTEKLTSTELVQEELRMTVSSLHAELGNKEEKLKDQELRVKSQAESHAEVLEAKTAELAFCENRVHELETDIAEKIDALALVEVALLDSKAACDAVLKESDESRLQEEHLQSVAMSTSKRVQELQEELDSKSAELGILVNQLQTVTSEMKAQIALSQKKSLSLAQELEDQRSAMDQLHLEIQSMTTSLEQSQNDLRVAQVKEDDLLAELLTLKEQLSRSDCDLHVECETKTRLQEEVAIVNGKFDSLKQMLQAKLDSSNEELAATQALALEHQSLISHSEQKIEADAQTISLLQENVEQLQSELLRKEEILQGLEFDISLLQEHTAEDTDFKQELLVANTKILELQGEVERRIDELKELESMKLAVENELSQKAAAMSLGEEDLQESGARAALVAAENQALKTKIDNLQQGLSCLEADLAEKSEALRSLEKELMTTRVTATRMTMEFSHKTEALLSLEGELGNVSLERDDLRAQKLSLVRKLDTLQEDLARNVKQMDLMHGDILVAMMTENCMIEVTSDMHAKLTLLEAQKGAIEVDLALKNAGFGNLISELLTVKETATRMAEEMDSMNRRLTKLQAERTELHLLLAQQTERINSLQDEGSAASAIASRSKDELQGRFEDHWVLKCEVELELILKNDVLRSLESELMTVRARAVETSKENDNLRASVSDYQKKHNDLEMIVAQKTDAISSNEANLEAAKAAASVMALSIDVLKRGMGTLTEEKVTLDAFLSQKGEAITFMERELTAARESISCMNVLKSKIFELQNERDTLENELQNREKKLCTLEDESEEFRELIAKSQADKDNLEGELVQKSVAMASLQDELNVTRGSSTCTTQEIIGMNSEMTTLQAELAQKFATISLLEGELVRARESACSSRDHIAALETKLEALQVERHDTQVELADARKTGDSLKEENAALEAQIVELRSELQVLVGNLAVKTKEISSLEGEFEAASASAAALRADHVFLEAQIAQLHILKSGLERELAEKSVCISLQENELVAAKGTASSMVQENGELRTQVEAALATKSEALNKMEEQMVKAIEELDILRAYINEQEQKVGSLEDLLEQKSEALSLMVATAEVATQECDKLRAEIEGLRNTICTMGAELKEQENAFKGLESRMFTAGLDEDITQELITMRNERDKARGDLQALRDEFVAAQSAMTSHKASALEAQKFAEVNILRANGKEEEARALKSSVSTLKTQISAFENQIDIMKRDADRQQQARDNLEMELQGMKNRMTMLQAVHSTGSRNFKGFQAAQAASLDLQRRLEEKENEVAQLYKKITTLHTERETQASRMEEMETELAHVHQELDGFHNLCEEKDAQINALNRDLEEAEALTQDVMRDLHSVKLDISNYASLVSQQQLELISERARHNDESQEKDEELSNLQTQLNQERQNWMQEINHKQAEIVVARVLSEKMRLKNKTLAAEYKRLKADHAGKKKKLKLLEQQLKQLTETSRRISIGTETETEDFDEVQQFQALLAQANCERAHNR